MPGSSPGNVPALAERFHVYTPDARGHGHTPDRPGPITPELLLQDTVAFLDQRGGRPGPPGRAQHGRRHGAARRAALPGPGPAPDPDQREHPAAPAAGRRIHPWPGLADLVRFLGPGYGEVSPDGEAHFPVVASKIVTMLAGAPALAQADLGGISSRTLLMAGDEDAVSLDDTLALYNGIPDAELAIVPGTSHFLLREKPAPVQRDHAGLPDRRTRSRRPPGAARRGPEPSRLR